MDRQVKEHLATEQIMKLSEASVATIVICVLAIRVPHILFFMSPFYFFPFFLPHLMSYN